MKIMAMDEVRYEDLDMVLDLLENDYFQAELQLELDEIAEKNRFSNTEFLGQLKWFPYFPCCAGTAVLVRTARNSV